MVTEKPLVNFHTDEELLEKLDRWQHHNLFSSRAEAIRWLIEYGTPEAPAPAAV